MNQLTALRELAEKVEAGEQSMGDVYIKVFGHDHFHYASSAFAGSLDAAHSLHKAVLGDGWTAVVTQNMHHKFWTATVTKVLEDGAGIHWSGGPNDNPARAWLLAAIRAKIAELEN